MKKLKLYSFLLFASVLVFSCSDPIAELDSDLNSPQSVPTVEKNVIPASITAKPANCTEYYVYAITSDLASYDRIATITIIKDAKTDENTGIPKPDQEMEQLILTIPAGAYVSEEARVLADASEEYDQDFTYKVEVFTDAQGNSISGYNLYERTYKITENCYMALNDSGGDYLFHGCGDSGSGTTSYGTPGGVECTGDKMLKKVWTKF